MAPENTQNRRLDDRHPTEPLDWEDPEVKHARESSRLANAMAEAGAALLAHIGKPGVVAQIPNTEQYVVAGTLPMIAKVLPAASQVEAAAPQQSESIDKDRQFHRLLADFGAARFGDVQTTRERLIAHIDNKLAKAAQAAPSAPTEPTLYVRKSTLEHIASSAFVKHEITVRTEPNDGWVPLAASVPTEAPALAEKVAAVRRDALLEAAEIADTYIEAYERIMALTKEAAPAEVPSQQGGEA